MKLKLAKRFSAMLISILMVAMMLPTSALAVTADPAPIINPSGTQPVMQDNAPTRGSLTISKVGTASTFKIYKLFGMAVATGTSKVYSYTPTDAFKSYLPSITTIMNDDAAALGSLTGVLHNAINPTMDTIPYYKMSQASNPNNGVYTAKFTDIDLGYYLVIEISATAGKVPGNDFLVSVPSVNGNAWNYDVTAKCKDTTPPYDKKIVKDSGDQGAGVMTAVKEIGEKVEYRLEGAVPQYDLTKVDASKIVFTMNDSISKGLDFNKADIYVHGVSSDGHLTDLTNCFVVSNPIPISDTKSLENGGNKITIDFTGYYDNIKTYSKIQVFYTATINKDAVIGTPGNPNSYNLTYSTSGGATTTCPPVTPYVFTTGIVIHKTDKVSGISLNGAVFTLTNITDPNHPVPVAFCAYDSNGTSRTSIINTGVSAVTDGSGNTYFLGLGEGTYSLAETTAPASYSLLPTPKTIKITNIMDNGNYTGLFKYSIDDIDAGTITQYGDVLLNAQVSDDKGFNLPGTGGIGTTIFTAVGLGIILLGGFMLLVYNKKKRHSAQH